MKKIPKVESWHSVKGDVYHNHTKCDTGNNIEFENRKIGTGNKKLCLKCAELDVRDSIDGVI
ncbi:unnamed protein product [marine sediment metagenome]|uniref:Uncharacterized protein n=1 Tax=marine sediment metagenome TaxID=412755 RepID=X1ERC0_9ZZZZ